MIDHKDIDSIAYYCKSLQETSNGLNNQQIMRLKYLMDCKRLQYFHQCISSIFIIIIHFRVFVHSSPLHRSCKEVVHERTIVVWCYEQKAIDLFWIRCMLWILMIKLNIHNTDAKCRKTKKYHICVALHFSHIGETSMENFHSDEFWSHLIENHLTLANFVQLVK